MPDPNSPDATGTPTLFQLAAAATAPRTAAELSPAARRVARQQLELAGGLHPLGIGRDEPIRLHPQAAPVDDRRGAGRRCGNCLYRQLTVGAGGKRWPKCVLPIVPAEGGPARPLRATRGQRSDVEAWWAGCVDHEYANPALRAANPGRPA